MNKLMKAWVAYQEAVDVDHAAYSRVSNHAREQRGRAAFYKRGSVYSKIISAAVEAHRDAMMAWRRWMALKETL